MTPSTIDPNHAEPVAEVFGRRQVLLVEDDSLSSSALKAILTYAGFDVTTALGVATAIARLDETPFDFVLLDLMLPDGEGTEVLAHIRRRRLRAAVLVASASSDDALMDRVHRLRLSAILRKPLDVGELLHVMRP